MSFVREHVPHLAADYERRYATMDFADSVYRKKMETIVHSLCRSHGLGERSSDALLTRDAYSTPAPTKKSPTSIAPPPHPQALLFAS
jgi:hypothetical protein